MTVLHSFKAMHLEVLDHASVHGTLEAIVNIAVGVGGPIIARSLARIFGRSKLLLHRLVRGRQENDLAVGRLGHGLHCLEVADLHGRSRGQNVGRLAHQFGGFNLSTGRDDLALTNPLGLSGHGERILQVVAKDDVLDEHRLNLDTPARGNLFDDLGSRLRNLLTALNHILQNTRSDHMAQGGLGTLDEGLLDVCDTEGGLVGRSDLVVDDGREVEGHVVLGHADLTRHFDDLDLDVDGGQVLAERVHLDQTGVDRALEAGGSQNSSFVCCGNVHTVRIS